MNGGGTLGGIFRTSRVLVLAGAFAGVVFGQIDRSSLTGTIQDQSQKVVPEALVAVTNATGEERRTRSNAKGVYELPDLPIGTWTVVFSAPGFQKRPLQKGSWISQWEGPGH